MRDQFARFVIVGALGFFVDAGMLWLTMQAGMGHFVGRAFSFLTAVWFTWQVNRRVTFIHRPSGISAWHEWWRYVAAMSLGGGVNLGVYSLIVLAMPEQTLAPFIGVAAGSLAGLVVNFASARWWVFRQRKK